LTELPSNIFFAMLKTGAMTPGKNDRTFNINFAIVEKEFPSYLEFLVRSSLNSVEEVAYVEGYMAYEILSNGLLKWSTTRKLLND
jgi:hypothetical protein